MHGLQTTQVEIKGYNNGSIFQNGIVQALNTFYQGFWILLLILGVTGIIIKIKPSPDRTSEVAIQNRKLQLLSAFSLFISFAFIGQLALLEADGGTMLLGGTLYLIPIYPVLLLMIISSATRMLKK